MRDVPCAAFGRRSLLNEPAADSDPPHVSVSTPVAVLSRRSFLIAGAGASCGLGANLAQAQADIWQEYRRDDVGFRIEMPGVPRARVQKASPDDNWITSTDAQLRYQNEIFDITWTEFKNVVPVEDEYTRFRNMMTGAGYRIEEDVPLTVDDVPAREFIIETGNINFIRRIMAVRNFAIAMHAMGPRNIQYRPTVRRFMDSFKLLRP